MTLVELLVAMGIAVMLTGMILITWFALQSSFANQARANEARDTTRDAVARMVREIRDGTQSENGGGNGIADASASQITISTSFNDPGASDTGYGNRQLTRFQYDASSHRLLRIRDTGSGLASGKTTVLADDVANPSGTPVFSYWYYDPATGAPVETAAPTPAQYSLIYAVEVDVWVDRNPSHPPAAVKLQSTAQIRNARQ